MTDSAPQTNVVLEVKNLRKYFPIKSGLLRRQTGWVKAVDDVSFSVHAGETLALVGESGCGKTTTGRLILRAYKPTSGEIYIHDNEQTWPMHQLNSRELQSSRRSAQMIFQDPFHSPQPQNDRTRHH